MSHIGCRLNPCNPCLLSKIINAKQHTLLWDADDIKALRVEVKVNSKFTGWAERTCRSDKLGCVKVFRGKKNICMGITINHYANIVFKIDTTSHISAMNDNFLFKINKNLE